MDKRKFTTKKMKAHLTQEELDRIEHIRPQMTYGTTQFIESLVEERIQKAALLAACKWTARGEHHRACSHYRKNPNTCDCYVGACKSAIKQAGESGE